MATKVDQRKGLNLPLLGNVESPEEFGEHVGSLPGEVAEEAANLVGHAANEAVVKPAQKALQKPAEEALTATEKFGLKLAVNSMLLLVAVALFVYGVMVMVRPPERALSLPLP